MDTETAIQVLQALQVTLTDEVKGSQAKLDAITLAIQQLQGTLVTQIDADQAIIAQKQAEIDAGKVQLADVQGQLRDVVKEAGLTEPTP